MTYVHKSVLPEEVLKYLVPMNSNSLLVDCTTGEGGHSELFLKKYSDLRVIGLDCDSEILKKAENRLKDFKDRYKTVRTRFEDFWASYKGEKADLILFDLGISMFHYEESQRGFSLSKDEKLDMRLDDSFPLSAADIVNTYSKEELANLIYKYGEERYSRRISEAICNFRKEKRIERSEQLAQIVYKAVPESYRHLHRHCATKTFQALRIAVNNELGVIENALDNALKALKERGRIAVITFHSLEDRIVKWFFRNKTDILEILTKKPVVPTQKECRENPPSRSAKLRVAEKKEIIYE